MPAVNSNGSGFQNVNISTTSVPTIITIHQDRDEQLAKLEVTILGLTFVLAIIGNSFVLIAIKRHLMGRCMSRMYQFMMHLSVADILVAVLNIFSQMMWDITFRFKGGDFLCRSVKYFQIASLYYSTYILVMMAFDRYRAVCLSSSFTMNSSRAVNIMSGIAAALSILLSLPQVFIFSFHEIKNGVFDCWGNFNPIWGTKVYVTWFVFSIFIGPLIVLIFAYGKICMTIWNYKPGKSRSSARESNKIDIAILQNLNENSPEDSNHREIYYPQSPVSRAKIKTVKLTLIVIICYIVCWSPFCFSQLYWAYYPSSHAGPVLTICLLLASLNSCTNPWIYLAFSGSLLHQLKICIGCQRRPIESVAEDSMVDDNDEHTNTHQKSGTNFSSFKALEV